MGKNHSKKVTIILKKFQTGSPGISYGYGIPNGTIKK